MNFKITESFIELVEQIMLNYIELPKVKTHTIVPPLSKQIFYHQRRQCSSYREGYKM